MIIIENKVPPGIKIRGMIVTADAVESTDFSMTEGLLSLDAGGMLFVPMNEDQLFVSPASIFTQKVSILQIDQSGNYSIVDGPESLASTRGTSISAPGASQSAGPGNINILLDKDMTLDFFYGIFSQTYNAAFDGTNFWVTGFTPAFPNWSIAKITQAGVASTYHNIFTNELFSNNSTAYDGAGHVWVLTTDNVGNSYFELVNTVDGTISTIYTYSGTGFTSVYFDGANMWAVDQLNSNIVQISISTGSTVSTTNLSVGSFPCTNLAYASSDGTNIWVSSFDGNIAQVVISTLTVTTFQIPTPSTPQMQLTYDGSAFMWMAAGSGGSNFMISFDKTSGATATYSIPGTGTPFRQTLDGSANVWIASNTASLCKFNTATQTAKLFSGILENVGGSDLVSDITFANSFIWVNSQVGGAILTKVALDYSLITISTDSTNDVVSADIQTQVRALVPFNPVKARAYSDFTANPVSGQKFVWAVNQNDNTVSQIMIGENFPFNMVVAVYAVGNFPECVVYDGTNIWVTNAGDNTATVITVSTGTPTGFSPVATGSNPIGICFDGTNIWIANLASGAPTVVVAATGAPAAFSPVASTSTFPAFDGTNVWVACDGGNTHVFNATTGVETGFSPIANSGTVATSVTFDGTNAWITYINQGDTYVVSQTTGTPASFSPISTSNANSGIFFGGNMWLVEGGNLNKRNITTGAIITTYTGIPFAGANFIGVSMVFDGASLWIAGSGGVNVFSPELGAVAPISPIVVGNTPIGLAYADTGAPNEVFGAYVLSSGTIGASSSAQVFVADTSDQSAILKLGVANGGLEVVGISNTPPTYPATSAGNILVARMFKPSYPNLSDSLGIRNIDIDNDVPGR